MNPNGPHILLLLALCFSGCDLGYSKDPLKPAESARETKLIPLTNMVFISAGSFHRLLDKDPVTLTRDYWLGKYEVTQEEYEEIMGTNPSHFKSDPKRPVEKVSYYDAIAYGAELTRREREAGRLPSGYEYRLPTEAEWEYACRAGTTNLFSFGESEAEAGSYAWTAENSNGATQPVGGKDPNGWGLHDMHGNVWEWCLDWFEDYPADPVTDPTGPAHGRFKVFRGGSWYHDPDMARTRNRFMMNPANGIYFVGFRIALSETHR
jgi:formylglycine-generating enzyme required for sulfatase activity